MSKVSLLHVLSITLSLLLLISCGPQPIKQVSVVGAFSGPSRWDVSGAASAQLSLHVDSDLAAKYGNNVYTVIDEMKEKWDVEVPGIEFFDNNSQANQVADPSYSDIRNYYYAESPAKLGIYLRDTGDGWFSGVSSSALAVTQYFGTVAPNGFLKIIHADIFINESVHNFKITPGHLDSYHLPTVILHELGHFLGLHHSNGLSDVMYPSLGLYNANTGSGDKSTLSNGDVSAISDLYNSGAAAAIMANNTVQGLVVGHQSAGQDEAVYRGVIELEPTGECKHYFNNELIYIHHSKSLK